MRNHGNPIIVSCTGVEVVHINRNFRKDINASIPFPTVGSSIKRSDIRAKSSLLSIPSSSHI